jgi:quinoprotein glucose dehydrogenase
VPGIFKNVIVVGANTPPGASGGVGNPRAFDARTGAKLWEFSSVAQPGTVGHDTWDGDSWKGRLGANVWPFYFTIDEQRGLLYLPLASPFRRLRRRSQGREPVWEFSRGGRRANRKVQVAFSDDPPRPLGSRSARSTRIVRRGHERTQDSCTWSDDEVRLSLHPEPRDRPSDFRVEERPMPKSDVPGEWTFPTQPIPVKPPALARVSYTAADLVTAADTTAEHATACADLIEKVGGRVERRTVYAMAVQDGGGTGRRHAWVPWHAWRRELGWHGLRSCIPIHLRRHTGRRGSGNCGKDQAGSPVPYDKTTPGRSTFDVRIGDDNWPCQKPPWGRLTAINSSSGDIAWQIPLGITEQLPADKQHTGRPALAGPIVTASGLLFIASTDDNRFRAST